MKKITHIVIPVIVITIIGIFAYPSTVTGTTYNNTHITSVSSDQITTEYDKISTEQNLYKSDMFKNHHNASSFNIIATVLFFFAIVHTLLAPKLQKLSKFFAKKNFSNPAQQTFLIKLFHLLGEVEIIFGVWALPVLIIMSSLFKCSAVKYYLSQVVSFSEPLFVAVIMLIAATRPILSLAETILTRLSSVFHGTIAAWWMTVLIISPFLGSFITEPAAITIAAMLLAKHFYHLHPSVKLKYATLGLLFVNISAGGTLTHFAAPPILMVAHKWQLNTTKIISMLGSHAIVAVIIGTGLYYLAFRKEFDDLQMRKLSSSPSRTSDAPIPIWITTCHCLFLAWTVMHLHRPILVTAGLVIFLAFVNITKRHQYKISLKSPLLVGLFLSGLVIHGGLQGWWIAPLFGKLKACQLFFVSTILTAFNDNAAITYLASLVPEFVNNATMQKAILSGAITGGGLTVIANAPNPAGQSILSQYFDGGISPWYLFLGALCPTIITALCFNLW